MDTASYEQSTSRMRCRRLVNYSARDTIQVSSMRGAVASSSQAVPEGGPYGDRNQGRRRARRQPATLETAVVCSAAV